MEEKKLSFKELEDLLVDLYRRKPIFSDSEDDFRKKISGRLKRIVKGHKQLEEVSDLLRKLADQVDDEGQKRELDLSIEKVNDAIIAMSHGDVWYNSRSHRRGPILLWNPPSKKSEKS